MINYHVDIVDIEGKRTIRLLQNSCKILCSMIFFHGNLMEFLTSCLWKFCLIYGILAFSDGNSSFEVETLVGDLGQQHNVLQVCSCQPT